jgi:hypothetical protein
LLMSSSFQLADIVLLWFFLPFINF